MEITADHPLHNLYAVKADEKACFGAHWCGPERFEHSKKVAVARYPQNPVGGDGREAVVYCSASPSRGYEIKVPAGTDYDGPPQAGFRITTGSGPAGLSKLVAQIAEQISQGMLNVRALDNPPGDNQPT